MVHLKTTQYCKLYFSKKVMLKKVMFQLDILAYIMALKRQGGRIFQKFYNNVTLRK